MMIAMIGAPGTSGLPTPPAQATPRLPTFAKLPLERMTYSGALPRAPGGFGLDMIDTIDAACEACDLYDRATDDINS